jgi:dTDP-4-amino-4,6-dideoxygalactose transaminase
MPLIPFNIPFVSGNEFSNIRQVRASKKFSGDGKFNLSCQKLIEEDLNCYKAMMTPSCTHALEMAAILVDIKPGDEVIMPSFTFPSSANAFVLRGATIVFVDIDPKTMNIDEKIVENSITEKTKALLVVHYGSVACQMDRLLAVCKKHNIFLIEDAAHSYLAKYKGKFLGTIGDIGCLSFHESKNIHCGEGGAILLNNERFVERAEIIREKGTDRNKFFSGQIEKYTWVDIGSSFLLSELNAAFLYSQLKSAARVNKKRNQLWKVYKENLKEIVDEGKIEIATIPEYCEHNGHLFYIKTKNTSERDNLIKYLNKNAIHPAFHYLPLHSSSAGVRFGRFYGEDRWTSRESSRLLRLPMFYKLKKKEIKEISEIILRFYSTKIR